MISINEYLISKNKTHVNSDYIPISLEEYKVKFKLKLNTVKENDSYWGYYISFDVSKQLEEVAYKIFNKMKSDNFNIYEINKEMTKKILGKTGLKIYSNATLEYNTRGRWSGDTYGTPWCNLIIELQNSDNKELAGLKISWGKRSHKSNYLYLRSKDDIDKLDEYIGYVTNAFEYLENISK